MIFIFSTIADLQGSVKFLLYGEVTQLHIHVNVLFSYIILHHAPSQVTKYSSQGSSSLFLILSISEDANKQRNGLKSEAAV